MAKATLKVCSPDGAKIVAKNVVPDAMRRGCWNASEKMPRVSQRMGQKSGRIAAGQTERMLKLGIILTAATVTILVAEFFRTRRRALPAHGWLGLTALVCAEYLMFHGVEPAATYFRPLAWTAYILLADAAIFTISGE